jgi:hypothetical protein
MRQVWMNVRIVFPVTGLVVLAACGGGDGGPAPGGGVSRVPVSLAISPSTDFLKLRASEALTAVVTMTGGATETVAATWTSDNAGVASVDASGRVTGSGSGQAGISAVYSGLTANRSLRVVPDYQGRWSGDHSVPGCVDDGDWRQAGFCQDIRSAPLYEMGLVLTQNRDSVTGTIDVGTEAPGAVQGPIHMNGDLGLTGTFVETVEGVSIEVTVSNWETRTSDNQRMTGRFRITFRAAGLTGSGVVDAELSAFTKTGAAIRAAGGDAGARRALLPSIRKVLRTR